MDNNPVRIVKVNVEVPQLSGKLLSQQGEHLATELQYYLPTEWLNPEYTYRVKFKLPDGDIKYADLEYDEKFLAFRVPQALTLLSGILEAQLTIYKDSVVAKCYVAYFKIQQSINVPQEVEDKYVGLLEDTIYKAIVSSGGASQKYVYFKMLCPLWSTPRVYFFNTTYSEGYLYDESWGWTSSPYMLLNEEGYYYFPIIPGFENVIFFCDHTTSDGFNYKTNTLTLPKSHWFDTPLFVQSDIGFDGFWADYRTKRTKLLIQHNIHTGTYCPLVSTKVDNIVCITPEGTSEFEIRDLGLVPNTYINSIKGIKTSQHYEVVEFPITCTNVEFDFVTTDPYLCVEVFRHRVGFPMQWACYEYPVAYLDGIFLSGDYSNTGEMKIFNAMNDEVLKRRVMSSADLVTTNLDIKNVERRVNYLEDAVYRNAIPFDEGNNPGSVDVLWDGVYRSMYYNLRWQRVGNVVFCSLKFNDTEWVFHVQQNSNIILRRALPYFAENSRTVFMDYVSPLVLVRLSVGYEIYSQDVRLITSPFTKPSSYNKDPMSYYNFSYYIMG